MRCRGDKEAVVHDLQFRGLRSQDVQYAKMLMDVFFFF